MRLEPPLDQACPLFRLTLDVLCDLLGLPLALVGLAGPVDSVWAVIFGVVLVVFVAVAVWNLSRVRRLSSRLAASFKACLPAASTE